MTATGRVGENTQTAYALALQFDLLPEELRPVAAKRLAAEMRERKHLTTGFVGTPYLCHVLSRYGYLDEAYMLLNRERVPVVALPGQAGRDDHLGAVGRPEAGRHVPGQGMNSFNHYAYGAIGEWMYRVMAGIEVDPAAPGYKHILIQPQPGGGFTRVKASHRHMYGRVSSAWALKDGSSNSPSKSRPTRERRYACRKRSSPATEGGPALSDGNGILEKGQDGESVYVRIRLREVSVCAVHRASRNKPEPPHALSASLSPLPLEFVEVLFAKLRDLGLDHRTAVPLAGVPLVIPLVILLGGVERRERGDLGDDRRVPRVSPRSTPPSPPRRPAFCSGVW